MSVVRWNRERRIWSHMEKRRGHRRGGDLKKSSGEHQEGDDFCEVPGTIKTSPKKKALFAGDAGRCDAAGDEK